MTDPKPSIERPTTPTSEPKPSTTEIPSTIKKYTKK